ENVSTPSAPVSPEPSKSMTPPATPSPAQTPSAPATGGDAKQLNMDVTDMSSTTHNTLSEKEDPNAVKYPGVSIPNMAKKEKLNNALIRSGKGEVDTNPYSESGVKPESDTKNKNADNGYGINSPVQKESGNKIMLKTDAITNPRDENFSPVYNVSNDNARAEEGNLSSDYKAVVGVKNVVKKEINDKISARTGRGASQENPTGAATGSKGSASKVNGVAVPNPVQKSTNSFINTKTKGIGLWE
ncbi:MAG: hypothetical protein ACPL7I_04970, partial [Myxococcota bacterium]